MRPDLLPESPAAPPAEANQGQEEARVAAEAAQEAAQRARVAEQEAAENPPNRLVLNDSDTDDDSGSDNDENYRFDDAMMMAELDMLDELVYRQVLRGQEQRHTLVSCCRSPILYGLLD